MTWEGELIKFYDKNVAMAGNFNTISRTPMGILFHGVSSAGLEISINKDGSAATTARLLNPKNDSCSTTFPVTQKSIKRTGSSTYMSPHPLFDKLKYLTPNAAFFEPSEEEKAEAKRKGKKIKKIYHEESYKIYIENLKKLCECPQTPSCYRAIYNFLSTHDIIQTLIDLSLDVEKSKKKIADVFVRFRVDGENIWENSEYHKFYIDYYHKKLVADKSEPCIFPTSNGADITTRSFSRIRENRKLFSMNDKDGYTYRGSRFRTKEDLPPISAIAEQKITIALLWLMANQSYRPMKRNSGDQEGRTFVIWGTDNPGLMPWKSTQQLIENGDDEDELEEQILLTTPTEINSKKAWSSALLKYIAGYQAKIDTNIDSVNILALEFMTPGRVSVAEYYFYLKNDFYKTIYNWHTRGAFPQLHRGKKYYGIPSPRSLAELCIANKESDETRIRMLTNNLIHCAIAGSRIPWQMVRFAVRNLVTKAATIVPTSKDKNYFCWRNNFLYPSCSLVAEYYNQKIKNEGDYYTIMLNEESTDRSYLFGRLLACAEKIEEDAIKSKDKKAEMTRATNAIRLMGRYSTHPCQTWGLLVNKLQPYIIMNTNHPYAWHKAGDILQKFKSESDFSSISALEPIWTIGYAAQRSAFFKGKAESAEVSEETSKEE